MSSPQLIAAFLAAAYVWGICGAAMGILCVLAVIAADLLFFFLARP